MAFEFPGDGSLDYLPCSYGGTKLMFRGPARDLSDPFCAVLGGTETYGKFVAKPFAALLEDRTGRTMVNLGNVNAGPDAFLNDPVLFDQIAGADLTIVQVIGALNLSNRFYSVHPRRNDRFLRASPCLQTVFREVDFTDFHFTRHMLQALQVASPDRFEVVAAELRAVWISRMSALLAQIRGPSLLLWMGPTPPPVAGGQANLISEPLLVDADMVAAVRGNATAYLEVVYSSEASSEGLESKVFSPMQRPAAQEVPGPMAHREVADALVAAIDRLL